MSQTHFEWFKFACKTIGADWARTMIKVQGLRKRFGTFEAVSDIGFNINEESGIIGLLGPNGAGKTTTMRLLTGYLMPDSGNIEINGISSSEETLTEIKRMIGYLPESTAVYPEMLVSEFLAFMGKARGLNDEDLESAARKMLDQLDLGSHFYSPLGILSKGFRQRAGIAGALIHNPSIIILDEPTSGLDPNQISQIRDLIRNLGKDKIVILSTHILQEVEDLCERVIIINGGKIVADQPTGELRSAEGLELIATGNSIETSLRNLDGVQSVTFIESEDRYLIRGSISSEKLYDYLKTTDWKVRSFGPLSDALESVFKQLTGAQS